MVWLAALTLLGAGACSGDEEPAAIETGADDRGGGDTTVAVDDNLFEPEEATVAVGDTVTWEWVGNEPHNVHADEFESEIMTEGTFEHTFEAAGTYDYVCDVHPGMDGTIEVTE